MILLIIIFMCLIYSIVMTKLTNGSDGLIGGVTWDHFDEIERG